MRVMILVNTLTDVSKFVYANHIQFFTKTVRMYPNFEFSFFTPPRMSIDNARNSAAQMALASECDYLMFIDDDVLLPIDTFDKLYKADKDIVAGLVIIRGHPFNVMAFKRVSEENQKEKIDYYNDLPLEVACRNFHTKFNIECESCEKDAVLEKLVECRAVGFSCCLIKADILKSMEPPYFVTGSGNTEDVYFCLRAKYELDPEPEIFVHTEVQPGHLLHPEPVEWTTRKKMQEFYGKIKEEQAVNKGRDLEYLNQCLAKIN